MRLAPHELARVARVARAWRTLAYDDAVWHSAWPSDGRLRPTSGLREAFLQQRKLVASRRAHEAAWLAAVADFNAFRFTDVRARTRLCARAFVLLV